MDSSQSLKGDLCHIGKHPYNKLIPVPSTYGHNLSLQFIPSPYEIMPNFKRENTHVVVWPGRQLNVPQPLPQFSAPTLPLRRMGRRGWEKIKLVSWDTLLGQKRKGRNLNNNKSSDIQHNCSPPTNGCSSTPEQQPLASFPPCSHTDGYKRPYAVGYPFGQLGSAFVAVSAHIYFCPCSLLTAGLGWGAKKPQTLCKHCLARTKMSVC